MSEKGYAWNPADYARHSSAQFLFARELIGKLKLKGNEVVLDIGSGDGKVTSHLAGLVPGGRVIGIDSSEEMVALARKTFPPETCPNLRFSRMDAAALAFENEFDLAFSNATLHWVHDQLAVLKGVKAALKPGGKLLSQMGGKGNAREIVAAASAVLRRKAWRGYFADFRFPYRFCAAVEYRKLLKRAGLAATRVELIPKMMEQRGAQGLAGWVRTTWLPYLERVPKNLRENFVDEVVGKYLKDHPPDLDGIVRVKMVRLEVEATNEEVRSGK